MLFNSIGAEKENRTIELLMLSINPRQLLSGKTLALGIAGLVQTVVWLAAIFILFNLGGSTLSLPEGFRFPVGIVIWSLVFFIGGFALYASLMAGAGALVPRMKEAGIANFIAMFPLFFGYMFGIMAPLAEATGSTFLVFLSIFPLTSPVVMVMRLTDGLVPALAAPALDWAAVYQRIFCAPDGSSHVPRPEFAFRPTFFGPALSPGTGWTGLTKRYDATDQLRSAP